MIAFWDALSRVLSQARHVTETETIPTVYAQSRVLAEDVYSLVDVPPADNSQMDGYAVRSAELAAASPEQPVALPVSARIPAGSRAGALAEGSVARIFTGAPVPRGADAVVPQELVTVDGDGLVVFTAPVAAGKFVRPAGGDLRAGQLVLAAGSKLTPARLGLLASTGRAYVKVYRPVRVAVFCSGNELASPGEPLPEGAIYNSNRFMLRGLLHQMGAQVEDLGAVGDTLAETVQALKKASEVADVIVTTGGMSVGEEDHIKPAVSQLGGIDIWRLAVKPGKPFAFGHVCGVPFLGLPGNPAAVFVETHLIVKPFLAAVQGQAPEPLRPIAIRADFDWKAGEREEFLRVSRNSAGGLDIQPKQNSQILSSCAWADGFVDVPAGQDVRRGDIVSYFPIAEFVA